MINFKFAADSIGCEKCHYHGTCYSRDDDKVLCECFQWYAGESCQVNLKGTILNPLPISILLTLNVLTTL